MTMMNIDDAIVVFEGINRLRWVHQPPWPEPSSFRLSPPARPDGTSNRILGHVWPDNSTRIRLRRLIDQHHKVVVVLDDPAPAIKLPRHRVPQVPAGAVELDGSDNEVCLLSIPPLTWLPAVNRRRGEEFLVRAGRHIVGTSLPDLFIEDELLGTGESLRFVYQTTPLTIDVLCRAVDRMYRIGAVAMSEVQQRPSSSAAPRISTEHRRAA